MNEKNLEDAKRKTIATFRFGVIAEFVTGIRLCRGERERLLKEKSDRHYEIPYSRRTRLTRSTLLRWVRLYRTSGKELESLCPRHRRDRGGYRKLDSGLRLAIRGIKEQNPRLRLPGIKRELTRMGHWAPEDRRINNATFYRFMRLQNLRTLKTSVDDRRAFEASLPNELWQADALHGPQVKGSGNRRHKTYLMGILDDYSRLIVHAEFYLDESLGSFRQALHAAISKRGIPHKLYIDNGACFRAQHLDQIAAAIGFTIHHSRPYTPQGRGKIERWFRTVRDEFLRPGAPCTHLDALNEALTAWVDEYNNRQHSVTGQPPLERYRSGIQDVRPAPPNLDSYFRRVVNRRVRKDRSFRLEGRFFEAPVSLIDKTIEIRFLPDLPDHSPVEVFFDGKSFGMVLPVDPRVNARVGRDWRIVKDKSEAEVVDGQLPPAAAPVSGELFTGADA